MAARDPGFHRDDDFGGKTVLRGGGPRVREGANIAFRQGKFAVADDKSMEEHYAEMDYVAHNNTYQGFNTFLKWGTIGAALATILAIWAIT